MATAYTDQVQKVYIAYYGRAADPVGLAYWAGKVETDGLAGIMANFGASAEATTLYGSLTSDTAKVNALYQQSFGRDADFAGLMYYAGQLSAGTMTAVTIAQNIFDGASGADATLLANKLVVAKAYTAAIDTAGEVVAYSGTVAATAARTLLSTVDADTVTASFDVATSVAGIVSTATSAVAVSTTFNLTSATAGDDLAGTSGNDSFLAANTARLQSADVLGGGAGNDSLTAKLNSATTHKATLDSIETLNFEVLAASTIDGTLVTGETAVNVTGANVLTYTSGVAGTAYSVGGTAGLTLTQAGTDATTDSVTTTLNAGKVGALTLGDTAGVDFETINLVLGGATKASLTEAGTPTFADVGDSIVVTGSGDFALTIDAGAMGEHASVGVKSVVDASGHTGVFTLDLTTLDATADEVTAVGYTGVDKIQAGLSGAGHEISKVDSGTEIILDTAETDGSSALIVTQSGTATNDTLTVSLNHGTAGTAVDIITLTVDGFETATINSTGTDNATTVVKNNIDTIAGTSTDVNLVISGDKYLTAGTEATWTNIDVTNTAGVNLTVAAGGAVNVLGGSGADRIVMDTVADVTKADVLNGGDGKDTLAISAVVGTDFTAAQRAVISNLETLEYVGTHTLTGAVAIDVTKIAGMNNIYFNGTTTVDDGATNTYTLTATVDSGSRIEFNGANANTASGGTAVLGTIFTVAGAADAGTADNVTVAWANVGTGVAHAGFSIDNVETATLELEGVFTSSDIVTLATIDGAQLSTLNIISTEGLDANGEVQVADSLIVTALESTMLSTLDASTMTGALTMTDISAFVATGATIKGGSAVDTFTGGVGADVMTGNAGADILNGDSGNDSIDGGAGADNINGDVGADTLTGGAGDDTFVYSTAAESTEAAMDKITDYQGNAADQDNDNLDTVGNFDASATATTAATIQANIAAGSATDVKAATTDSDTSVTAYITNGIITLAGTEKANVDTIAEWIDVAELMVVSATTIATGDTNSSVVAFEFDGNTYVVEESTVDVNTTETVSTSAVIQLVGVTGITAISATAGSDTILVA
jgi:hypothetical protein